MGEVGDFYQFASGEKDLTLGSAPFEPLGDESIAEYLETDAKAGKHSLRFDRDVERDGADITRILVSHLDGVARKSGTLSLYVKSVGAIPKDGEVIATFAAPHIVGSNEVAEIGAVYPANTRHTGCNDLWDYPLQFLDRHNLDCPSGSLMKGFKMSDDCGGNRRLRYTYDCLPIENNVDGCSYHETGRQGEFWDKPNVFLDRHKMTCPNGKALKGWQVVIRNNGWRGSEGYFKYQCCNFPQTGRCHNRETQMQRVEHNIPNVGGLRA